MVKLIFKRVTDIKSTRENQAIGTWKQIAGNDTTAEGEKTPSFGKSDQGLLIVTPTHWMRMNHRNQKFEGVLYGTYTLDGDTVVNNIVYSSYPLKEGGRFSSMTKVNGKKVQVVSKRMTLEGKPEILYDIFEKVNR